MQRHRLTPRSVHLHLWQAVPTEPKRRAIRPPAPRGKHAKGLPHDTLPEGPAWQHRARRKPPRTWIGVAVPLCLGLMIAVMVDRLWRPEPPLAVVATVDDRASTPPPPPAVPDAVVEPTVLPVEPPAVAVSSRLEDIEQPMLRMLQQGKTPYAAVVVTDVHTGRVLAMVEHSERGATSGLAMRPVAPAASVFKVVTAAALLDAHVSSQAEVCFHGGKRRMQADLLVDNHKRDRDCVSLHDAVAHSTNVAMAKFARKHLDHNKLTLAAEAFQFGKPMIIEGAMPSVANIPASGFAFAEVAAGFGDVKLSALHGAVMAGIVANGGVYVAPALTDDGQVPEGSRVLSARTAQSLQSMLSETVTSGTAHRAFQQNPRLGSSAAGKTGSLTDYKTKLDTSWFIGYAPAENPEVAIGVMVINEGIWHIKAAQVAKEGLRLSMRAKHKAAPKAEVLALVTTSP